MMNWKILNKFCKDNYKKALLLLVVTIVSTSIYPQKTGWGKIDSRKTPQWWLDAKFGIFIHWGLYSVPAYSKLGEYSEWYWKDLVDSTRSSHAEIKRFHDVNYGKGLTYPDFATSFTCELFDPQQWAQLFKNAGAKYVVLTSKHHDGYCLWNSAEANKSWGRPWNSTETGPQRDLLGDLTDAVRNEGVEMGIYYSLYEWFNPLYTNNIGLFVENHMLPQFKDVVTKYKPSVIFSDGEWEHPSSTWRSTKLLNWLLEESPCKEKVVINDRWGKECRHKHGGYYTTEFGSGLPDATNPWEENRGMAYSFGYSRTENLKDYKTAQELIYMLIDIVSRGGNFLLDIGPTSDGRIPVIMQERLTQIGDWLKVNGEAIYGTSSYIKSCQWSNGKIADAERGEYKTHYDILQLTVNPEKGYATKEIFFTKKGNVLFCICPVVPNNKLIVRGLKVAKKATVTILGIEKKLKWAQKGANLEIELPQLNPFKMPCQHALTFKIEGIIEK